MPTVFRCFFSHFAEKETQNKCSKTFVWAEIVFSLLYGQIFQSKFCQHCDKNSAHNPHSLCWTLFWNLVRWRTRSTRLMFLFAASEFCLVSSIKHNINNNITNMSRTITIAVTSEHVFVNPILLLYLIELAESSTN